MQLDRFVKEMRRFEVCDVSMFGEEFEFLQTLVFMLKTLSENQFS